MKTVSLIALEQKLQTKLNLSLEHSFLKQNRTLESTLPIFNEYLVYMELSKSNYLVHDLAGYYEKITRLRMLTESENYNHRLLAAQVYRRNFIQSMLNVCRIISDKRSERQRTISIDILIHENEVNSIENSFNDCIVSVPKILKLRTA